MITVSVCMIVKNEEKVLRRCLDSLKGIWDELVIVDTGSTDSTKKIAYEYTDAVYDFKWIDDFSAARNFAMSKATMDYIYMADADEVIDKENFTRFKILKEHLLPEIEIVQMWYANQLECGSVYNFDKELRPKLYKRLREFTFIEPIHETVRLEPVVFESDIVIEHRPLNAHSGRDFKTFRKAIERDGFLSDRLTKMYATELMISGKDEDFKEAEDFFLKQSENSPEESILKLSYIILLKIGMIKKDSVFTLKYALKDVALGGTSEGACLLGMLYEDLKDYSEAAIWYYNAKYETKPELSVKYSSELPLEGLIRVYEAMGDKETAESYRKEFFSIPS